MQNLSGGQKAYVGRLLKKAEASAPRSKLCPRCKETKGIEQFGMRTMIEWKLDKKGGKKFKARVVPQSYCVPCRAKPSAKASKAKETVTAPVAIKVATLTPVKAQAPSPSPKVVEAVGGLNIEEIEF